MRNGRVYCLSTVDLDRVFHIGRRPGPDEKIFAHGYDEAAGGQGVFVARALAGLGIPVTFVGAVGDDPAGASVADELARIPGLAIDIQRVPGQRTGTCVILVDGSGEKSIVLTPLQLDLVAGLGAALRVSAQDVVTANFFHPTATAKMFGRVRAAGGLSLLDLEIAAIDMFGWGEARATAQLADVVCTNAVTLQAWCRKEHLDVSPLAAADRFARHLGRDGGVTCVTLGADGVWVTADSIARHYPAHRVRITNTTGAGDTFLAGLAAALRDGDDPHAAVQFAQAVAADFLTHGAVDRQRIEALVQQPRR